MIASMLQAAALWLAVAEPVTVPATMTAESAAPSGGPAWVVAVNLVIWTGLFLYLLRLERRLERGDGRDGEDSR